MLAIGRALMARPKLLMLDEPSLGIAPILVQRIYQTIGKINSSGVTILLVEQNANYALTPPPAVTCSRPGGSSWPAIRPACATTPRSSGRTWAHD